MKKMIFLISNVIVCSIFLHALILFRLFDEVMVAGTLELDHTFLNFLIFVLIGILLFNLKYAWNESEKK